MDQFRTLISPELQEELKQKVQLLNPARALAARGYDALMGAADQRPTFIELDKKLFDDKTSKTFQVGFITLSKAQIDLMKDKVPAEGRYEIYARALRGENTSLKQITEIGKIVRDVNPKSHDAIVPPEAPPVFRHNPEHDYNSSETEGMWI